MSDTATMTLADFLLARLAEEAKRATDYKWADAPEFGEYSDVTDCDCQEDHVYSTYLVVSPARVLAEGEAKRRIIAEHGFVVDDEPLVESTYGKPFCTICRPILVAWPCPTLRALALPYADHPEYRSEWAPA